MFTQLDQLLTEETWPTQISDPGSISQYDKDIFHCFPIVNCLLIVSVFNYAWTMLYTLGHTCHL